jgi:hypothetical protein
LTVLAIGAILANQSRQTLRTLLAPRSRLAARTGGAVLTDHTGQTRIALFTALTGGALFTALTRQASYAILARHTVGPRRPRQPRWADFTGWPLCAHRSRLTALTSHARGTGQPLRASGTRQPLGTGQPLRARGTVNAFGTGWAMVALLAHRPRLTTIALQANPPHRTRVTLGTGHTGQTGCTGHTGFTGQTLRTLGTVLAVTQFTQARGELILQLGYGVSDQGTKLTAQGNNLSAQFSNRPASLSFNQCALPLPLTFFLSNYFSNNLTQCFNRIVVFRHGQRRSVIF